MPAKWFKCPDNETIEISTCLRIGGCRLGERCASLRFLRKASYERKWKGISPSSAGNGERLIYLTATTDYALNIQNVAFRILGIDTHGRLEPYDDNLFSEEKLSDESMEGIPDCLEVDEYKKGYFILYDDKTWGSYKVAKALGIVSEEETVIDEKGEPILFKSGKRKGLPKTRKVVVVDPTRADKRDSQLQLNRYRIMWEPKGFPISKMFIEAIIRDGGTAAAYSRHIDKRLMLIPIERLSNDETLQYYQDLNSRVNDAFKTDYAPQCNNWENWNRKRCEGFCDVKDACIQMSKDHGEKWGIL